MIGVMVGNKSNNRTYVGYLKDVVGRSSGTEVVNGDGSVDVGNAVTADFFKGEFESLGGDPPLDPDRRVRWHADRAEAHRHRTFRVARA